MERRALRRNSRTVFDRGQHLKVRFVLQHRADVNKDGRVVIGERSRLLTILPK